MLDEEQYWCDNCGFYVPSDPCPMCGSRTIDWSDVSEFEESFAEGEEEDAPTEKGKCDKTTIKRALKKQRIDDDLDAEDIDLVDAIGADSWEDEESLAQAI